MKRILFLRNYKQFILVKKQYPYLERSHIVITNSPLIYTELQSQGCPVNSFSTYLESNDFNEIIKQARVLSKNWYVAFEALFTYEGINLGELARIDNICFFREILAAERVLNKLATAGDLKEVVIIHDGKTPCIWESRYVGTDRIFEAMALRYCTTHNIAIKVLELENEIDFFVTFKHVLQKVLCVFLSFNKNTSYQRVKLASFHRPKERKLIVGLGENIFLFIMNSLLNDVAERQKSDIILVNMKDTIHRARDRAGFFSDRLRVINLSEFKIDKDHSFINANLKKARDAFEQIRLGDPILSNPYLNVQFDFLWKHYFSGAIEAIDCLSNLFEKLHPDVVAIANAMGYTERAFVKLAKKYNTTSVTIPHGWINDIDEYEFESDWFFSWGELTKKELMSEFNKSAESIKIVGAPQFDYLRGDSIVSKEQAIAIKEDLRFNDNSLVVIFTRGFSLDIFSSINIKRFIERMVRLREFIEANKEINFILKPHPHLDNKEWYSAIIKDKSLPNIRIMDNMKPEPLIAAMDAGILFESVGTIGCLLLLAKKPFVLMKGCSDFYFPIQNHWYNNYEQLLIADKIEDGLLLVSTLLTDHGFRQEWLSKNEKFLQECISLENRQEISDIF